MILNDKELKDLGEWTNKNVRANELFFDWVAKLSENIWVNGNVSGKIRRSVSYIYIRTDKHPLEISWWQKKTKDIYNYTKIYIEEEGPWWDEIRRLLPERIKKGDRDETNKQIDRELMLEELRRKF